MAEHLTLRERREQLKRTVRDQARLGTLRRYLDEEYMNGEGVGVIDVCLYEGLDLYDPLSWGRQRELNPEIYGFIEQKANLIPAQVPLRICFHGHVPPEDQAQIRRLMAEHYSLELQDRMWDMRSNRHKLIGMVAVGVVFLSLYFFFALREDDGLFLELLSVIGSFALWEAADCFLLERRAITRDMMNIAQHMTQEVVFQDDL